MIHPDSTVTEDVHVVTQQVLALACADAMSAEFCEALLGRFELWLAGHSIPALPVKLAVDLPAALRCLRTLQDAISNACSESFAKEPAKGTNLCLAFAAYSLEEAELLATAQYPHPETAFTAAPGYGDGRFRDIVENAPVGIFHSTIAGRFIDVNQTVAEMFGYPSPAEMVAGVTDIPAQLFVHPEDRLEVVQHSLEAGSFVCHEVEYRRRDGSTFFANLHMHVAKNATGEIDYVEGFVENITARLKNEMELRESEARYRHLLETLQEGIWAIDADARTTYVNSNLALMLGYAPEEMLGRHLYSFMDDEGVALARQNLERRKQGIREQHDFVFARKDGGRVEAVVATSPLIDGEGKYVGAIAGVINITGRKSAESEIRTKNEDLRALNEELHSTIKKLEAANEDLRATNDELQAKDRALNQEKVFVEALLESIPGLLYVYDEDGNLVRWNNKHVEMTGYTTEELSHMSLDKWFEGEDAAKVAAAVEDIFQNGYGEVEANLLLKDGRKLLIHSNGVRLTIDGKTYFTGVGMDITESKRAEDELRRSEERFRSIVESSPTGMYFYTLDSGDRLILTGANPSADRLIGIDHTSLVGKTLEEAFPSLVGTDIPRTYKSVARGDIGAQSFEIDYRDERFSGTYTVHVFRIGPCAIAVDWIDVSERKLAEDAIRESEARFRTIVASIPGAVYRCELRSPWRVSFISDAIEGVSGYPASEFLLHDRTYADLIVPEDLDMVSNIVDAGIADHRPYQLEYRIRHRDGSIRYMFEKGCATYADDGTPLWLDGVNLDVTERRGAEDALRESEYFFKESQRAAFIGSYKTDFTVGRWESSEVLDQIFGIDQSDGRTIQDWIEIVHPDDREMMARYLREEVIGKGRPFNKEYRITRRSDGHVRYVHGLGEVDSDSDGNVVSLIGTIQDITERKLAEDALEEAGRAKDRFLALLSHELRNPLATIVNAAQVLKTVDTSESRLLRARDAIERAAASQARLLEDLLDVSRITLDRVTLQVGPVHLDKLAGALVRSLAVQAASKGLDLSVDAEPGVVVNGDETRLEQVLFNLVVNAIKYTDSGSVWVTIHRDGAEAVVTVRDTGVGIDAEMLPQVFEMFTQADETLAHAGGGLGLGLALVKLFVELHGGTVTAESAGPGRGSTFTVRLPIKGVPATPQHEAPRKAKRIEFHRSLRVLLVDDNVDARETMRDILELDGCIVYEAGDGYAAIESAVREKPDVVLLDIGLPGLDGYAVARELRARSETECARIIAVTGYGQESDRELAIASGFDEHLTKPVDLNLLRAALLGSSDVQAGE